MLQSKPLSFNPSVHGLRALAAIAVLLFHWGSTIGFFAEFRRYTQLAIGENNIDLAVLLDFGWLGVPLFFVLSGYLLGYNLHSKPLSKANYFDYISRRFKRIFPAYWSQLVILFALSLLFAFAPQFSGLAGLLKHVFLWVNLPPWMEKPVNPVWWTLPVEFSFYLLLPFMVWLSAKVGAKTALLAALVVTLVWRAGILNYYETSNYAQHIYLLDALPGVLFTFAVGMYVGVEQAAGKLRVQAGPWALLISVAALLALITLLKINIDSYWSGGLMLWCWPAAVALAMGAIVYCCQAAEGRFLTSRSMVFLGDLSFGIYLWHYPVLIFLKEWLGAYSSSLGLSLFALLALVLITVLLSYISYRFIEKPFMHSPKTR